MHVSRATVQTILADACPWKTYTYDSIRQQSNWTGCRAGCPPECSKGLSACKDGTCTCFEQSTPDSLLMFNCSTRDMSVVCSGRGIKASNGVCMCLPGILIASGLLGVYHLIGYTGYNCESPYSPQLKLDFKVR